jgi:branched-chain amino acid transport system permease protein
MVLKRYEPLGFLAAAVVALPVATSIFGLNFYLTQLTMSAYYIIAALGLCILMGYAGQISLGQAAFFAIGGYASALITTLNFIDYSELPVVKILSSVGLLLKGNNLYGDRILYITPWVGFIAALILSALIAFIIGIPVLKLKGHYLAMATLGFGVIIEKIVRGSKLFGGADGITNVPPFEILPGIRVGSDMQDRILNYFLAWFSIIIVMFLLGNLINSRTGRAMRALHGREDAALSMGIDSSRYKLYAFVISAVMASAAGILMTHYSGSIGPGEAGVMKSIRYAAIVAVGGMGNIWGTMTMGLILNFLSLRGVFGSYDDAVFGSILIIVMMFSPGGFIRQGILKQLMSSIKIKGIK